MNRMRLEVGKQTQGERGEGGEETTLCIVRSQFSSMTDCNRTVDRGASQALTGGGAG